MKYLLVLVVVGLGLWMLLTRLRGGRGERGDEQRPGGAGAADAAGKPAPGPVVMVECAHCGLHLAAADALPEGSRLYCSDSHRRLGPGPGPSA